MDTRKRFYALLLAMAMILALVPTGVFAEEALVLTPNEEMQVEITEGGQAVWLSFTPEESGNYLFRSDTEDDVRVILYDEEKAYLSEDDDGGIGYNFILPYDLEAGQTYYYKVSFWSEETIGTVPVKVYRNPFESLSATGVTLPEYSNGEWVRQRHGLAFFYDYADVTAYEVTFTDGSSKQVTGRSFAHQGDWYEVFCNDEQSADATWEAGNTYTGGLGLLNMSCDVQVEILKVPVKRISPEPVTVVEDWDGYGDAAWNPDTEEEETFIYYNWIDKLTGTVTMEDGSVLPIADGEFTVDGHTLHIKGVDSQGPGQAWEVGKTYEVTAAFGETEATLVVTVAAQPEEEPDGPEEPVNPDQVQPLTLDVEQTAQIAEGGDMCWFSYTPEQTDLYCFSSFSNKDTCADLYDEQFLFLEGNDDGGTDNNFLITYKMEAGKTYYFAVYFWNEGMTGEIPVKLYGSPIKSISNAATTVLEYMDGSWETGFDEENEKVVPYFHYDYLEKATYTVTFADNSTMDVEGGYFEHDGVEYYLSGDDDQDWNNRWEGGNTYTAQLSLAGVTCDVAVTVEDLPIERVQVEPISIIEGQSRIEKAFWNSQTQEWDYCEAYDWSRYLTGTVTLEGGHKLEINGNWAYDDDDIEISLYAEDDQSNTVAWTAGNTYNGKVLVGDREITVPVSIVSSPVKKVEAKPITLYGDIDAHFIVDGENGEGTLEYFLYYWEEKLQLTVTFADGSTYTTQPGQGFVEYEGKRYAIETDDSQTHEVHWQIGQTYTGSVSVLGKETTVPVTVGPAVFQKIELSGISIQEGTEGYWDSEWDDETEEEKKYFHYEWEYLLDGYTVTYADGTVESGSLTELDYMEVDYPINFIDEQSADDPWISGNTYDCQVRLGTHLIDVKVTITASAVARVELEPIIMTESDDGEYYWNDHLQYTVTMQDGTKVMGDPEGFRYQGKTYWAETDDDQDEEPWGIGAHTGTVLIMGKEFSVPVYIGEKVDSGKYSYVLYENKAYICDSRTGNASLTIPTTIDQKSVVGVVNLGADLLKATQITIPDQITHLDPDAFYDGENVTVMKRLTLGAGVKYFSAYTMYSTEAESVTVSQENDYYCSTDGVVYNKAKTELVCYPWAKSDSHSIPNTVKDIEALVANRTAILKLNVTLGTGTKDQYVQENGIVFSKDKKTLVFCNSDKTGSYVLPATVTKLGRGAFARTGFTSITLHDGIAYLPQMAFYGCTSLAEVDLPQTLDSIGYYAFGLCGALKTIRVPEGVEMIEFGAFIQSGLTTVYIPETVEEISVNAFFNTPLTDVFYDGTREQWEDIYIYNGNEALLNADIHFKGERIPGDVDDNSQLTTDDAVYLLLNVLFGDEEYPLPEGIDPDFDGNGQLSTDDAVYLLLNAMFGDEEYPLYG